MSQLSFLLLINDVVATCPTLLIAPANTGSTALNTDVDGYKDLSGNGNNGQGVDANGNSTNIAEEVLSYPPFFLPVTFAEAGTAPPVVVSDFFPNRMMLGVGV